MESGKMLKKILIVSCLFFTSVASHAGIISHYGYSRDTESTNKVVTGGGVEWLMWDVTKGMSISSALDEFTKDGWVLATNVQMASLFNSFQFGKNDWLSIESQTQYTSQAWDTREDSSYNAFFSLFGAVGQSDCGTNVPEYCYETTDPYRSAMAFFGSDLNKDGYYNLASLVDDSLYHYDEFTSNQAPHEAIIYEGLYSDTQRDYGVGIALVRMQTTVPTPVSVPGTLVLLLVGLAGLVYSRRSTIKS
jgi:hypothetical protein